MRLIKVGKLILIGAVVGYLTEKTIKYTCRLIRGVHPDRIVLRPWEYNIE